MRSKIENENNSALPQSNFPETENKTIVVKKNFRFIVTNNIRNAWLDELYEDSPDDAKRPTFH